MGTMYDAVNPANIPAEADGHPALRITVLGDAAGEAFDLEAGNAGAPRVAAAMKVRDNLGHWSIGYVNEATLGELEAALGPQGLRLTPGEDWPAPGVYLWCADPSGNIAHGSWRPPVSPLAIQIGYEGNLDTSATLPNFPAMAAGYIDGPVSKWPAEAWGRFTTLPEGGTVGPAPAPAPPAPPAPRPQPQEVQVLLPVLQQGNQGEAVRAAQRLVTGLADDGIFGPATRAGVVAFQEHHGLAADGVIGKHTWGALLGAPQ